MLRELGRFLSELRASSEARKRRWLIGLSSISMLMVVSVWAVYLSSIIETVNIAETNDRPKQDNDFFAIMARGTATVSRELASFFLKKAETTHEIIIETGGGDYQVDDLPAILPREIR